MNSLPQLSDVDVRPLWVLPDAAGLALLAGDPTAALHRGGAAVVGEVQHANDTTSLVLFELDGLAALELTQLVRGHALAVAGRATVLPEALDPALACVAPSLAEARRLVDNARQEVGDGHPLHLDTRNLTGGTVECARIEASRLFPDCEVEISGEGRDDTESGKSLTYHRDAAFSDNDLAESLEVLGAHPAQFRPVIHTAFGRDELPRLRSLVETANETGARRLDQLAGRLILHAASITPRKESERLNPEPLSTLALQQGTPAARALEKVASVPGYRQGRSARGGGAGGKLSANESPFGPPPIVRTALRTAAETLNRYPEEGPVLIELAAYLGVDVERVILTNGSDELCYLLARLVLDDAPSTSGARRQGFTVVGDPCYQIDATASTLAGAPIVRVPLIEGAHDLDAMALAAREGATLVWLPSPHNPTGVCVASDELVAFLDEVPGDCLVVLDEAYGGFARRDDSDAALKLSAGRPNLLVQRTFSKDWGLAGLRVGYAVGDAPLIGALRRARPPFSVNALALAAVSAVIGCEGWRASVVAQIVEERSLLESALEELGVAFFPSEANFVTCALSFTDLRDALTSEGLSVRDGADLGLPGWTRITVGWAPQMAALRDVLRRHVAANAN